MVSFNRLKLTQSYIHDPPKKRMSVRAVSIREACKHVCGWLSQLTAMGDLLTVGGATL